VVRGFERKGGKSVVVDTRTLALDTRVCSRLFSFVVGWLGLEGLIAISLRLTNYTESGLRSGVPRTACRRKTMASIVQ
jgi:hypothetical protein